MSLDDLIKRADLLIEKADEIIQNVREDVDDFSPVEVDSGLFHAFRSASLSFLILTFRKNHPHYNEFDSEVKHGLAHSVRAGRGILSAARDELAGGWLNTTRGLVSAEIFSDFLEMAQHLLDAGYEDPAAVVVGSVLEEHLRQLCQKHNIPMETTKQGRPPPQKSRYTQCRPC